MYQGKFTSASEVFDASVPFNEAPVDLTPHMLQS